MQNTQNIERILDAFRGYLNGHKEIDVIYSEKWGYLLLSSLDLSMTEFSVKQINSAEIMCKALLEEQFADFILEEKTEWDSPEKFPPTLKDKFARSLISYTEKLPEYENLFQKYL